MKWTKPLPRGKSVILSGGVALILSTAAFSEPVKENIGLYGGYIADIEAMDDAGTTEVLIAVENSQRGVYRYVPASGGTAAYWESTSNPTSTGSTGHIPGFASEIEEDQGVPGHVYVVLSNERTSMNKALYESLDYGRLTSGGAVSWTPFNDPSTGLPVEGVEVMHGHSTGGMYAATRTEIFRMVSGGGNIVFETSSLSAPYDTFEIVDFAVTGSKAGYVVLRDPMTNDHGLVSTQWNLAVAPVVLSLPPAAPVENRTGTCPLSDCSITIDLIAADPQDATGDTIYIAGSSINGMVFKSTDGGSTWDDGYDYQCEISADPACSGFGFTDGYPRGDVVRFRGVATSGTESRHVFVGRVVFDNDNVASGWDRTPPLQSLLYRSGPGSSTLVSQRTNANDPALDIDPNDSTRLFIATDLAVGEITHDPATGYADPSGREMANAQGIEGLVINDLDYFENSATDKELWIATKGGAAFARGYNPADPTSVATAGDWVYPVFAGGDGAPHRAVAISPSDKANVLVGIGSVYRNETGDGVDPSSGAVDFNLVADVSNWSRVFDPLDFAGAGEPLESDRADRSYATAIEWQDAGSCNRVYLSIANTDTGTEGGIFYSDDDGATWQIDTLNSSSPLLKMPVNSLLVTPNFVWAGVGDRDGRSSETGIRARVSLCGTSAWWEPSHGSDPLFADLQTQHVTALDGNTVSGSTTTAVVYVTTLREVIKGEYVSGSCASSAPFDCWQFSDVTPTSTYDDFSAVAVEPSDTDHVWVAFGNCIQESVDGGATWSDFGGSCVDDHEEVDVLVYDDLIAGTSSGAFAYVEPPPPPNTAPTAFVAPLTTVVFTGGSTVSLDASESSDDDGDALTYSWTQTQGPDVELSAASAALTTFTAPILSAETVLSFEVEVSDGDLTDTASVDVTVAANSAPDAVVSGPSSVAAGAEVTIDASNSTDAEGAALSFAWEQTAGPAVELSSTDADSVSFTAPNLAEASAVSLQVDVSDGSLSSAAVIEVSIAANNPPSVSISAPASVAAGASVTLDASATSDPEGDSLTYSWSQTSGPSVTLSSTSEASVSFTAPSQSVASTVAFSLEVSDGISTVEASASVDVAATSTGGNTGGGSSSSGRSSGGSIDFAWLALFAWMLGRRLGRVKG